MSLTSSDVKRLATLDAAVRANLTGLGPYLCPDVLRARLLDVFLYRHDVRLLPLTRGTLGS